MKIRIKGLWLTFIVKFIKIAQVPFYGKQYNKNSSRIPFGIQIFILYNTISWKLLRNVSKNLE